MIVYNVKRRWFDMKIDAETYRKAEGLPASAIAKVRIADRRQLAAFLTGLCEPFSAESREAEADGTLSADVLDRSYVELDFEIPKFLRDSWARLTGKIADNSPSVLRSLS